MAQKNSVPPAKTRDSKKWTIGKIVLLFLSIFIFRIRRLIHIHVGDLELIKLIKRDKNQV